MTVHMFMLQLDYPEPTMEFFGGLFPFITFDMVPTDDLYEEMFNFNEHEEDINSNLISDQFEILGYEYVNMIGNMGSMYLYLLILPI